MLMERPSHLPEDTAIYEKDGELWGLDDYGEFRIDPPRGTAEPQDGRCGATLRHFAERYGERRYCGQTPYWPADDCDEEPSDFCRTHRNREPLMERAIELVQHGYFGRNYLIFEQSLDASELAMSIGMFAGLLEQSQYDFEVEVENHTIDASEDPLIEEDEIPIAFPLPQSEKYMSQAQELWYFALDEIVEQRMQNIRLQKGVDGDHVVATADDEGAITDTITEASESHLNLPISRLSKDKKERLKIGGVEIGGEDDGGMVTFQQNDYTLDVTPDDDVDEMEELEDPVTAQLEVPDEDD